MVPARARAQASGDAAASEWGPSSSCCHANAPAATSASYSVSIVWLNPASRSWSSTASSATSSEKYVDISLT